MIGQFKLDDPHNAVDGILSLLDDIDRALTQVRALADRLRQVRESAEEHELIDGKAPNE